MLAESRSNRPKVHFYSVSQVDFPLIKAEQTLIEPHHSFKYLDCQTNYQLKLDACLYWIYRLIFFTQQISDHRQLTGIRKLGRFLILSLFLLLGSILQPKTAAQSVDILTPEQDQVPQPKPLPPSNNPLERPLDAPPLPESVLDIP